MALELQFLHNGKWTKFYPVDCSSLIDEQKVNYNNIDSIPDHVYGKYVHGYAGYNPVWMYKSLNKKKLRII